MRGRPGQAQVTVNISVSWKAFFLAAFGFPGAEMEATATAGPDTGEDNCREPLAHRMTATNRTGGREMPTRRPVRIKPKRTLGDLMAGLGALVVLAALIAGVPTRCSGWPGRRSHPSCSTSTC